jgi:hypothetical protein
MPTQIYETHEIIIGDGTVLEISPLKIKYLKQFMDKFEILKNANNDDDAISILVDCVRIAMKQYCPEIKTYGDVEDKFALPDIYTVVELAAGIRVGRTEKNSKEKPKGVDLNKDDSWENLDLAKLESEVFVLGMWKNYEDLETSICMPELMAIIESKRDLDYNERKFLAAMQGVDLDEASGKKDADAWEAMKARVASKVSGIGNGDPNDILSLQGQKAAQAGFGIGMGLDYEVVSG